MALAAIQDCGFKLYLSDKAPSDFNQFPNLKDELISHHFATDNDIIDAVNFCLGDKDAFIYESSRIAKQSVWTWRRDYVKKINM